MSSAGFSLSCASFQGPIDSLMQDVVCLHRLVEIKMAKKRTKTRTKISDPIAANTLNELKFDEDIDLGALRVACTDARAAVMDARRAVLQGHMLDAHKAAAELQTIAMEMRELSIAIDLRKGLIRALSKA